MFTPDSRTNSLVVSAPVESLALIERIVAELDSTSPQLAQIKVFPLVNADATQMASVLSELFRLSAVEGGAGAPGAAGSASGGQGDAERSVRYALEAPGEAPAGGEEVGVTLGSAERASLVVTVDERTNSLLVGGAEHYVTLAEEIVSELDSSPAREQEIKVYRLKNAQAAEIQTAIDEFFTQRRQRIVEALGTDALGSSHRLFEEEATIVADAASNTLLVSASARYFEQIRELIDELDQPQPQVLIQVLLAEVTLDDGLELGFEWNLDGALFDAPSSVGTDFGLGSNLSGLSATLTGGEVSLLLQTIKTSGRLKVLSRPQILAADNQQAEINVGQSVPQITASVTTELGNVNNTVEYREVGVILSVTPRISLDGFIQMDVEPEISSLSNSTIDFGTGVTAPVFNERKATTTVTVQDGHTIIIGGLISTSDEEIERKVPILGDIPLLGLLFRDRVVTKRRTELLIVLTPHVLTKSEDATRYSRQSFDDSSVHDGSRDDRVRAMILDDVRRGFDGDGRSGASGASEGTDAPAVERSEDGGSATGGSDGEKR